MFFPNIQIEQESNLIALYYSFQFYIFEPIEQLRGDYAPFLNWGITILKYVYTNSI